MTKMVWSLQILSFSIGKMKLKAQLNKENLFGLVMDFLTFSPFNGIVCSLKESKNWFN